VYETTRCRRYAEPFHEIDTGVGTPFHCTSDYSSGNKPTDPVASDPLRRRTRENNTCILVVERSAVDGDRMVATLRVLFGYQTRIDRTFSVPEAVAQLAATSRGVAVLQLRSGWIAPLFITFLSVAFIFIAPELAALHWSLGRRATIRRLRQARLAIMAMIALTLRLGRDWCPRLLRNVGLRLFRFRRRTGAHPLGRVGPTHRLVHRVTDFGFGGWEFECGQNQLSIRGHSNKQLLAVI